MQAYHVLLVTEDREQTEHLTSVIREVANCQIDVMSRLQKPYDWVTTSNYQLVVIDTAMMDDSGAPMGGLALLEQIKRSSPVTSVILIADTPSVEQAVSAIRMGAEDYFRKPFNLESFQLAVKRGLDRKAIFGQDGSASGFMNLLGSCQMISASLDQRKIFEIIRSFFTRELKVGYSATYSLHDKEVVRLDEPPNPAIITDRHQDRAMQEVLEIALHASNPLPRMTEAGELYRFIDRGQFTPGIFIFRFRCASDSDYFCVCLSPEKPALLEAFESRLKMFFAQIETTGKNIQRYLGVQNLVYLDDATGLYNTRYLNFVLDREITQAKATQKGFAVLFMDLDLFKGVNDSHGHLVGTKLLHEMGIQLRKFVREKDTVFRYGGDEFVAVLSPCDLATAKAVAERIRVSVDAKLFLQREALNLHITMSIGVALFPDHADSKKAVIEAADHAMYVSKKSTRNAVTIATVPAPPVPETGTGGT